MKSLAKKIIVLILSFNTSFASGQVNTPPLTLNDLKKQYPNTEIKVVSLDELNAYKTLPKDSYNPCGKPTTDDDALQSSREEATPSLNFDSYSSGGNKDFLIIVAIVGVIVVASLVIYSATYLYQMAQSGFECQAWRDFGIRHSYVHDQTESQFRSGKMTGAYFTSGYRVPFGVMGLTGEIGYHSLLVGATQTAFEKTYSGTYLLFGPSFSFPFQQFNGNAFQIELLAGTSTEKGIGLMSTLRFGVDLRLAPEVTLGLNLGAALIDIKDFDNYLNDSDQLNYLSGASMSYRW